MTIERLKQVKNVISDVYQGFAGCSTGGCCGVSLPKEDQDKLKQWKQDMQQKYAFPSALNVIWHAICIPKRNMDAI